MRKLALLLFIAALLWLAGFAWFVQTLPVAQATVRADAIVVLTGGPGRVEQGLASLAHGDAPVLFISGVGQKVSLPAMIAAHASPEVQARIAEHNPQIILDYAASSTRSNASEAATFVAKHNIRSVRLVTAHYHMRRSLIEFRQSMPGVMLVPDPVVPQNFRRNDWWRDESTQKLIVSEFHKYIAACLLSWLPRT